MNFNDNEHCIDYTFDPPEPEATRPRSWHEVFPGSHLLPQNNSLFFLAYGEGLVEISDIVLYYHATMEPGVDPVTSEQRQLGTVQVTGPEWVITSTPEP